MTTIFFNGKHILANNFFKTFYVSIKIEMSSFCVITMYKLRVMALKMVLQKYQTDVIKILYKVFIILIEEFVQIIKCLKFNYTKYFTLLI